MKLSKLKKYCYIGSILLTVCSCNNHSANNMGKKDPVVVTPTHSKDTVGNTKVISPNKEKDQQKIDSIKQNKPKPGGKKREELIR